MSNSRTIQYRMDCVYLFIIFQASYFSSDVVAFEGLAKMFEHSWKEELAHGQKLIEYGLMRGVSVRTPDVAVS